MIPGDVVHDRFEIERLAGSGGMGTVYRARDRATDKRVAFKVLKGHDREERERFAREATALAELSHPGIVEYVAHGRTPGGDPFLVMEWLDGETLSDVLRWKRLTVAQTLTVAVRIAEALSAMHQKGVLHRDLKPSNLLIVEGDLERIKILDFGIVRIADASTQITATGAMLGTPGYMAPEQARGVKDIDTRADVFALGCVLFKCLTGNAPFGGSDVLAVLLKVVLEDAPRASDLCPEVPQALDELVARMLSKSPADRPADGAAVLEELRAFAHLRSTEPATRATVTRAELTATERRVVCLVLARVSDTGSDPIPSERIAGKWPLADDKTTATIWSVPVPSSPSSHIDRTIPSSVAQDRAIADVVVEQFQGELEALADGSLLVTFHSAGAATDLAARAARCALAVQALLGGVPTVLVTGRGVTSAPVPIGEIIDRGVKLLAQPGSPPPFCGRGRRRDPHRRAHRRPHRSALRRHR